MKTHFARTCVAITVLLSAGCREQPVNMAVVEDPELLHTAAQKVSEAMMVSVTSPTVASRTYAYSSIAAYEALRHEHPEYRSLAGQLNGLGAAPAPKPGDEYLLPLSSVNAYLTVAEALVFAPEKVAEHREAVIAQLREQGVPKALIKRSMDYGEEVGQHVLAWAGTDNIKLARASERLEIRHEDGLWLPTPPAYMDAVEPNWGMLRPFVLDSASQFAPSRPAEYDMTEGSDFHRQVMEVYETGRNLTPEQRAIAAFWDCNPFVIQSQGHFTSAKKQLSPGGHWIGITAIALRKTDADMMRAAEAYTRVSVALADGFISAWDEKYRSVRVRPVTVVQKQLDPRWEPLLQTPPFPEYPSGHSVISASAAEVLTEMFGDNFAFADDTEVAFGLPVRSFTSFRHAAEEAAMSRLYGGIHYRDGIEDGLVQGKKVGQTVATRLGTRDSRLARR